MKPVYAILTSLILLSGLSAQSMFFEQGDESNFEAGLGVTNIDGKSYTTFSITPDITIGKFGIGLNIELLFDNSGGWSFRKTGWDDGAGVLRATRQGYTAGLRECGQSTGKRRSECSAVRRISAAGSIAAGKRARRISTVKDSLANRSALPVTFVRNKCQYDKREYLLWLIHLLGWVSC